MKLYLCKMVGVQALEQLHGRCFQQLITVRLSSSGLHYRKMGI